VEEFPFNQREWQEVADVSMSHTNATLADDAVLQASLYVELQEVLDKLRRKYGEHPILIETAADFGDDATERRDMYRSAVRLAEANGLPTFTIRISLGRLLLQEFDDPTQAAQELSACEAELAARAD
jgi:hypothetical protein